MCPVGDERLIESVARGMVPLVIDENLRLVVAPRAAAARRIAKMVEDNPNQARHFRFTTSERLNRFAMRCAGRTIAARASDGLARVWPMLSAAPPRWRGNIVAVTMAGLASLAAATLAPVAAIYAIEIMLAAIFLAWLGLRLAGALVNWIPRESSHNLPDDVLPTYTMIAALYREASSVDGLLSAIERLDYPGIMAQTPWRALYQLIVAPYAWEKTEHGLAKSSRLNADMTRSLIELERYLTDLENGLLPATSDYATYTSANRPRRPRAPA